MRMLLAATAALLTVAGCAEFPVYENAYYQPTPAYYQPARVFYAQAPLYVERTTIIQSAPRVIRQPVVAREPIVVYHPVVARETPRGAHPPVHTTSSSPHGFAAHNQTVGRAPNTRETQNKTRDKADHGRDHR